MSSNLLRTITRMQKRFGSSSASAESSFIGAREIVGFGFNGVPNYVDRLDFPLPAVRFRPDTPDIKVSKFNS